MKNKYTKKAFIKSLNRKGVPDGMFRKDGGIVPNSTKFYGMWLYHNDPIRFEKLWNDWIKKGLSRRTFTSQEEEDRRVFWNNAF
jgi:hypothetical protein